MAEVKWIKVCTDIFDDEKIQLIDAIPARDSILIIWFKLLCLAGKQNNGGVFLLNENAPYTDEMLTAVFHRPLKTVKTALKIFEQYGMIERVNNAVTLPNWEKHQNTDGLEKVREKNRERVAAHRERQKEIAEQNVTSNVTCNVTAPVTVTPCNNHSNVTVTPCNAVDKDIDIEEDIEVDYKERYREKKHKYGEYKNVLLSDGDYAKLIYEFADYSDRIERLSEYMESSGKKYKNHLATIRTWAKKDALKNSGSNPFLSIASEEGLI